MKWISHYICLDRYISGQIKITTSLQSDQVLMCQYLSDQIFDFRCKHTILLLIIRDLTET